MLDDRWVGKRSRSLRTKAADSGVADARQTSISGTEDKRGPGRDEIRSGVAKAATEVAVFGRPPGLKTELCYLITRRNLSLP